MNNVKRIQEVWVPHLKKVAVKNLPEHWDYTNPPLTPEARIEAGPLVETLFARFGKPDLILTSRKIRSIQTAEPAVNRFGNIQDCGCPVISLDCLGQPESGDFEPDNPKQRGDGWVIYGNQSTKLQWFRWFQQSRQVVRAIISNWENIYGTKINETPLVWYFSHTPMVAAARYADRFGYDNRKDVDKIDDLDPTIKPYLIFRETLAPVSDDGKVWQEIIG